VEQPPKLKHYELLSRLGEGGMGVVYRARDTRLGRVVALKVLPEELGRDEDRTRRFEREARIASSISHPGIATLYDIDREGETAFLTMELVEGSTVRQLLESSESLPLRRILDCAVQVAEAMAAAHRGGIVHRDLKPENIMAADSGYFKVLDFGIARIEDPVEDAGRPSSTRTPTRTWMTQAGAVIGTVAYMSPEQALGEHVDARSDIFSFGSLLYEMVTGRPAFHGVNEIATAQAVTNSEPAPLAGLRSDIPDGLADVITKCLAKRPDDRYASAVDLADDLRTVGESLTTGSRTGRLHATPVRAAGRRRWALVGGVALGALIVVAAILMLNRGGSPIPGHVPVEEALPAVPPPAAPGSATPALTASSDGRPRVVVAFFENNSGDPEADWLSRGLPEMLTTDLSRSEGLEVIATQRLYDLLEMSGTDADRLDRSTTAELARWAGADLVISGSVFRMGEQYRLDAQAYDTRTGTVVVAHKVEGTELFRMVDELTAGIRGGLKVDAPKAGPLVAATRSEEAYRKFVRAKDHYDRLRFDEAAAELRQALELDPGFDAAKLRLALSLDLAGDRRAATDLVAGLGERLDGMAGAEGLLARGLHAFWVERDVEGGNARMDELVRQFPQEKEAFVWWGRSLADLGDNPMDATRKLRQAIEIDPSDLTAIAAMAWQLADLGATEDADRIIGDAVRHDPESEAALRRLIETFRRD
jgi:TolB-like protein